MVKLTDHSAQSVEPNLEEFAVPDKTSLGWAPAEHVAIHLGTQEVVEEFYIPQEEIGTDGSVVEFTLAEASATDLLADIDAIEGQSFDLANLLGETEGTPERANFSVPDNSGSDVGSISSHNEGVPHDTGESDVSQLSFGFGFPLLTILVDDASDPDSVVI